jgi:hypothetical protein
MLNTKTLTKLLIITSLSAVAVVALIYKTSGSAIKNKNMIFLPNLVKNPEQIATLIIQDHAQTLTLHRSDNVWEIVERNNFPVVHDKVEELLFGLADVRIVESKTANPDLYNQLDLTDISDPASKAILVTIQDKDRRDLARVLIGKREGLTLGEEYMERIFVRKANEQQTWLVQGLLPLSDDIKDWVEQPLLSIVASDQVKSLTINCGSAKNVVIDKNTQQQEDFVLEQAQTKPGMTLDVDSINALPYEVAELEFYDVVPLSAENINWQDSIKAELETFAGLKLTMDVVRHDNKVYAKVKAHAGIDASNELKQIVEHYNVSKAKWYYLLSDSFYKSITIDTDSFMKTG